MNNFNSGVYQIVNQVNGKRYIGSSSDLYERKYVHLCLLRKNKHFNNHLQRSYNKYGEINFIFEILLHSNPEYNVPFEQRIVDSYNLDKELYNIKKKVESNLGAKFTEEHKRKIGDAHKGKIITQKTRGKIRKKLIGYKHTDEAKKNMSNAQKEMPPEVGIKKSKKLKGKKKTSKHIENIRKSKMGDKNPMYNRNFSKEHRKKIGDIHRNPSEEVRMRKRKLFLGINNPRYIQFSNKEIYFMLIMKNHGWTYNQIAKQFGCTPKVVVARLNSIQKAG